MPPVQIAAFYSPACGWIACAGSERWS